MVEEISDKFVQCPHCGSELCYSQTVGDVITLTCMSCGFTTTSELLDGSPQEKAIFDRYPSLYKDLRFIDKNGYVWYPAVVTVPGVGMVYIDGSSTKDWQWVSVPARKLTRHEKRSGRYPNQEYIAMPDCKKAFGQEGFAEAMASLGLFGSAEESSDKG